MGPKTEGVPAACWTGASFMRTSVCTPTGTRAGRNRAETPSSTWGAGSACLHPPQRTVDHDELAEVNLLPLVLCRILLL